MGHVLKKGETVKLPDDVVKALGASVEAVKDAGEEAGADNEQKEMVGSEDKMLKKSKTK